MRTKIILSAMALGISGCILTAQDAKPAPNGPGGSPGPHLLPRGAQERLNLTGEQQKQLADLEADVKAKLEKILTPEQLTQLQQMRPAQGQRAPRPQSSPASEQGRPTVPAPQN